MKRIFLFITLIVLVTGCSLFKKDEVKVKEDVNKEVVEPDSEPAVPQYTDDNPIKIGLYERNGNKLKLLTEYSTKVEVKKDIKTFQAFPSIDEEVTYSGKKYGDYYFEKWDEVNKERKYKTGFNLKYTLNDGTEISQNIFGPTTTQTNYDYIEVYLYDAYTHRNDSFYSHIEEKDTEKDYYITSIKLTAGSKFKDIKSKIILTTFTYDEDDFDPDTNEYRGISKSSVVISDLNNNYEV